MKRLQLLVGVTAVGFVVAAGCGDDGTTTGPNGGSGNGDAGSGADAGQSAGGSGSSTGGLPTAGDAGSGTTLGGAGGGGNPDGCGTGPLCDEATERCIGGKCLLIDGEACTANEQCVNTCIGEVCAPRADVLETCDFAGGGGAGGAGGAPSTGTAGAAGEAAGGAPQEVGNGDDADCLEGLGCDSGDCKRKITADCTSAQQCLSGLCHKSKCTPTDPGSCTANECPAAVENTTCLPTTLATNSCSFNYLPSATCILTSKAPSVCDTFCRCNITP